MQTGVDHIGVNVTYFCHDGAGNVVMQKRGAGARDENHRWDIGGGAVEFGQTVTAALYDEVKEEYCADIREYTFLGYRDVHRDTAGVLTHWLALDFMVRVDPTQVTNGEPHKFEEVAWFPVADMPENVHSQLPHFLALYKDTLGL